MALRPSPSKVGAACSRENNGEHAYGGSRLKAAPTKNNMTTRYYFIIGTDTNVGNTMFSATVEVVYGHAWRGKNKPTFEDGISPITFKSRSGL